MVASPVTGGQLDLVLISRALKLRSRLRWIALLLQLCIGTATMFIGPAVMTGFAWAIALFGFGLWWNIMTVFWCATAVMVPLQFWTELRTRGSFLMKSVGGGSAVVGGWLAAELAMAMGFSGRSVMMAYRGADTAGLVELMLWGPRQVISALHKARLMRRFHGVDLDLESRMLQRVLERGRAMTVTELGEGGDRGDAVRAVAYLAFYDWAGVGESDEKVWALSETKAHFKM